MVKPAESRNLHTLGPADFLHDLIEVISPFLKHDGLLDDMLRQKAANALCNTSIRADFVHIKYGVAHDVEDEGHAPVVATMIFEQHGDRLGQR